MRCCVIEFYDKGSCAIRSGAIHAFHFFLLHFLLQIPHPSFHIISTGMEASCRHCQETGKKRKIAEHERKHSTGYSEHTPYSCKKCKLSFENASQRDFHDERHKKAILEQVKESLRKEADFSGSSSSFRDIDEPGSPIEQPNPQAPSSSSSSDSPKAWLDLLLKFVFDDQGSPAEFTYEDVAGVFGAFLEGEPESVPSEPSEEPNDSGSSDSFLFESIEECLFYTFVQQEGMNR